VYTYTVTNPGDCPLQVTLTDSMIAELGDPEGDNIVNGLLDPGETWTYTVTEELICECQTMSLFTNKATVVGVDEIGGPDGTAEDTACWSVIVFQWQPRTIGYWGNWKNHYDTIGYWGNWKNHYDEGEFDVLLAAATSNSDNLGDIAAGEGEYAIYGEWYGEDNVHDFLLGKPPKLRGTAKAEFLMEKQFLATWLNVKAYMDWVDSEPITDFDGSPDAAMDPNATVFLNSEAEVDLFGSATPTVMEILEIIETEKGSWEAEDFQEAYHVLDKINNAGDTAYRKFIPQWFEPTDCPAPLYNSGSFTPQGGASDTSGPVYGWVFVHTNPSVELITWVILQGATPDSIYSIWVNQYPDDCPTTPTGSLTTDSHGNGNAYVTEALLTTTTEVWVSAVGGGQVLRSTAVTID